MKSKKEEEMPPYSGVKSKSQGRKLFALVRQGKMSEEEARGKMRAAEGKKLPEHVEPSKKKKKGA